MTTEQKLEYACKRYQELFEEFKKLKVENLQLLTTLSKIRAQRPVNPKKQPSKYSITEALKNAGKKD